MLDIVMACFNPPNYLQRMLESIKNHISDLSQIEVYIIDDCSNYSAEYQELIEQYNVNFNCHYLKTEINSGPAIARNLGLKNSYQNFIAFVDDDDIITADMLKFCNSQYDIITTFFYFMPDNPVHTDSYINPVNGMIFNRDFLNKYQLEFPLIHYGAEDSIFRSLCFVLTDNILRIEDETESFYYRCVRNDSCFGQRVISLFHSKKSRISQNSIDLIEKTSWLAIFSQELEKYCKIFPEVKNEITWNERVINALASIVPWNIFKNEDQLEYSARAVSDYYLILLHFMYAAFNFKTLDVTIFQKRQINNSRDIQMFLYFLLSYTKYENNILTITPYAFLYSEEPLLYQQYFMYWDKFIDLSFPTYYFVSGLIDVYANEHYVYYGKNKDIFI